MSRHGLIAAVALFAAPAAFGAALPTATATAVLDNGLRVIAVPLPSPGIVAVQTWVRYGSGREVTPGTTGYAHFFEHLSLLGTPTMPALAREARLLQLGVEDNAWTSTESTCYHQVGPASSLDGILDLIADGFQHRQVEEKEVRREAGAVYGELRQELSDPDSLLLDSLWATAFRVHPYAHPVIGLESDVAAMPEGTAQVIALHDVWYRPDNMTVVIAGDVDPVAAVNAVKLRFEGWKTPDFKEYLTPTEPAQTAERRVDKTWTDGQVNARLAVGWHIPAFRPGDPDSAALDVVRELVLARAAPLSQQLIDKRALAWSVWNASDDHYGDPGLFSVAVELRDPDRLPEVEDAVKQAIADLAAASPASVAEAAGRASRSLLLSLGSPASWAYLVGDYSRFDGDPAAFDHHVAAIGAVKPEDIARVTKQWLNAENRVVVTLRSAP